MTCLFIVGLIGVLVILLAASPMIWRELARQQACNIARLSRMAQVQAGAEQFRREQWCENLEKLAREKRLAKIGALSESSIYGKFGNINAMYGKYAMAKAKEGNGNMYVKKFTVCGTQVRSIAKQRDGTFVGDVKNGLTWTPTSWEKDGKHCRGGCCYDLILWAPEEFQDMDGWLLVIEPVDYERATPMTESEKKQQSSAPAPRSPGFYFLTSAYNKCGEFYIGRWNGRTWEFPGNESPLTTEALYAAAWRVGEKVEHNSYTALQQKLDRCNSENSDLREACDRYRKVITRIKDSLIDD